MNPTKVYAGIGLGKAYLLEEKELIITEDKIDSSNIPNELTHFQTVHNNVSNDLDKLILKAEETIGADEALIFKAHKEILEDPEFIGNIKQKISRELCTTAFAIEQTKKMFLQIFSTIEDSYIRERSKDIADVSTRLIYKAQGLDLFDLSIMSEDVILFAKDLTPSQTVNLNQHVKGIVLEEGSTTSHAAIVAKAKGIPTLVGVKDCMGLAKNKQFVILDATKGLILVEPAPESTQYYEEVYQKQVQQTLLLKQLQNLQAITTDDHLIKLYGNAGSLSEAKLICEAGGEGIGLLRTEFIYMQSKNWPTEEEQVKSYEAICSKVEGEVIIRTLDIGGDKNLSYHTFDPEMNPFLGLRAIRFCLKHPDIFITQLKAILRVSANYPVGIMFPMISQVEEVQKAKFYLKQAMDELSKEQIAFNPNIRVGIMVEIPSVVISADLFMKEVDFVSIGTNDLCQYTLAIDRMNTEVSYLYQPLHPSILRMIQMTVESAHKHKVEVAVCGEMAGDPLSALILVGLGVDELSMSASMIPQVKKLIRTHTFKDLKTISTKACTLSTIESIQNYIKEELNHVN